MGCYYTVLLVYRHNTGEPSGNSQVLQARAHVSSLNAWQALTMEIEYTARIYLNLTSKLSSCLQKGKEEVKKVESPQIPI